VWLYFLFIFHFTGLAHPKGVLPPAKGVTFKSKNPHQIYAVLG